MIFTIVLDVAEDALEEERRNRAGILKLPSNANLLAQYDAAPGSPFQPAWEPINTIVPVSWIENGGGGHE